MNNPSIFYLPFHELAISFGTGVALGFIYLYLLWMSVKTLPRVKHTHLFLFVSMLLRLFLLIFGMILLSQESAGRFIAMFCGVILTRLIVLKFTKIKSYQQVEDSSMKQVLGGKKLQKKELNRVSRHKSKQKKGF